MRRLSFIIALFAVLFSCKTPAPLVPYEVVPITAKADTTSATGLFYALPKQHVDVKISLRKQEFIKGQYAEFAERLLGVKNAVKDQQTLYHIDNVMITQKSVMDPEQVYFVKFNDSKLTVNYDNSLIISGVNWSKPESSEVKELKSSKQSAQKQHVSNRPLVPTFNLTEENDTVFKSQVSDTQQVQSYEVRTVKTEKTPLKKAEEIVDAIAKIREDRNKLLTGFQEVNYEAAAFKYMNDEFNRREDEYIRLFTGTTKTSYETAQFEFFPENKDSLTFEIASFSTNYGLFCPSEEQPSDVQKLTLRIDLQQHTIFDNIQKFSKTPRYWKRGFYYNIPNQAVVTISLGNQVLYSEQMPFSQFGITTSLAPNPLQIEFSPQTGEILSIKTLEE